MTTTRGGGRGPDVAGIVTPTIARCLTSLALSALVLVSACTDPAPEVVEVDVPAETPAPEETTEDAGSSPSSGESAPDQSAQGAVSELSLCGGENFDKDKRACAGMVADVTTNALHCSAMVDVPSEGAVTIELFRDGTQMFDLAVEVADDDVGQRVPVSAELSLGEMAIAGGSWECRLTLPDDTQASAQTSFGGPTETFSQGMSCDEDDTYNDEYTSHCLQDEPDLPVSTTEVACSSVAVTPLGSALELWVDYDTDAGAGAGERRVGVLQPELGVSVMHITMTSEWLLDAPQFSPGDYACRVMLEDEELGSHDFTMS